ncbi:hypothetical protein CY34DRAFT_17508 [Suillus luteus UH-Slu-Lm8-n1]|uniref:Uncharacterized protein n=1 Tax=Suillus luteus UH-Slu-Lm8-n1 TaxID=930992 RepID=A0A0D0A9A7_9AGAM|nr:hypothetical protein CY34DRAFT_17508 [Suillus luteus UH-Slu-Lm8-n1]
MAAVHGPILPAQSFTIRQRSESSFATPSRPFCSLWLPSRPRPSTSSKFIACIRGWQGSLVKVLMLSDKPLSSKYKDEFLIQSTLITPEKEIRNLQEFWNAQAGTGEEWKV